MVWLQNKPSPATGGFESPPELKAENEELNHLRTLGYAAQAGTPVGSFFGFNGANPACNTLHSVLSHIIAPVLNSTALLCYQYVGDIL